MNAFFTPFSILSGVLAGQISKRLFQKLWGAVADEEAPKSKHREIGFAQLIVALLVEGAVARLVKGLVDHGGRHAWAQLTGEWPGEERPEPA